MSDVATCRTCGLPRFNGPAGYAGAQCLCQWKGATLPKMYDELMAKNAALEAENARLREERDSFQRVGIQAAEERDAARAELAEVKGREAVPVAIANKGECAFWVSWTEAGQPLRGPGIKLYTTPPASPDVEGLVNELQRIAEKCSDPDTTDALDTALSTWRQAQEGKP